jgi:hypothetical protein
LFLQREKTMSKRKIAGTVADPTLPKTPIEIDGKNYLLCFEYAALAEAEHAFQLEGHDVNLLQALPNPGMHNTGVLFAAAVRTYHPELGFEGARALVNLGNVYAIAVALQDAWKKALPETKTENPPQAVE